MTCIICNSGIPEGRVQFLIENHKLITCLQHSKEEPVKAFMSFEHKTAGFAVIVPNNSDGTNNAEKIRIAKRAYNRER
jgi:hypothetical protein